MPSGPVSNPPWATGSWSSSAWESSVWSYEPPPTITPVRIYKIGSGIIAVLPGS